ERKGHLPPGAPAVAADVRDQLVETGIGERVVLHLADRPPTRHAQPDRRAEDPRLGKRRVEAAIGTEPLAQAGGRTKDPSRATDVLADHHHGRVTLELDVEAVVDRLDDRELSQ